eukprot:9236778-Ditylum_brightwellii.AAC.1
MEVLDALLGNEACNSNLKDLNDQTPIHSVICFIERAADHRDNKKVEDLTEVLKKFLEKRPKAFHEKGGKTNVTGLDLGRDCKVEKVQKLFRGLRMILNAIQNHEEFNVQDFNALRQN